ncbi:hypothetical protein TVAG_159300 [Trichomonas vaginalis G3]|uniref:DUF3447 domain-containing protein n=1 Tax=Trichomonas vaginalis (strain ATCC PRA-98 / G3) TaxID=412133 RepID=A2F585_TRIV3|nr:spectrin binding [Trichomonas vaginalis G3]EAX99910.1 hypothetical protein TVAG_159300 [Trichomonas vaginalis G3]KAI5547809.1 spectrin binding [Trichomonas vaginalis G3]|eukprot:XP_001312840.1 hypothetical protein [Trichomonas vaginalis G3]
MPAMQNSKLSFAPLIAVAAYYRAMTVFQTLLDKGVDLEFSDFSNHSIKPLFHYAVAGGNQGIIQLLLTNDCNLDGAIIPLIRYGHLELAKQFVDFVKSEGSSTFVDVLNELFPEKIENKIPIALKLAIHSQKPEMLDYVYTELIKCCDKSILYLNEKQYRTALHYACKFDNFDIIEYLFNEDPFQICPTEENPITPLHIAFNSNRTIQNKSMCKLIQLVVDCPQLKEKLSEIFNLVDYDNMSILHHASKCGNTDAVKMLLDLCPEFVNASLQRNDGFTPIMLCVSSRDIQTFTIFIEKSKEFQEDYLNIFGVNNLGRNILHIAARQNFIEGFIYILDFYPQLLYQADYCQMSPLISAVIQRNFDIVDYIIEREPEFVSKDFCKISGKNLLHWLAKVGNAESLIEKILTRKLIDVDCVSFDPSLTPLSIAVREGHAGTVQTLINFGADPNFPVSETYIPSKIQCSDYIREIMHLPPLHCKN